MTEIGDAAVIGLGLMGGSVARELAARGARVLGHDTDGAQLEAAERAGCVHEWLDASLRGVRAASLVVIAVPARAAPGVLATIAPHLDRCRLVTDLGSTKRSVAAAAERLGLGPRFVGAHPLAGDHRSGWGASRAGLFQDALVYLCPTPSTRPDAMDAARALWHGLGARTETLEPAEHDRRLAWTSHLPQAASSALALALAANGLGPGDLGPGGRDSTRLAGSSPAVWTDIALDNGDALAAALAALEDRLGELRRAVAAADATAIHAFFDRARSWTGS